MTADSLGRRTSAQDNDTAGVGGVEQKKKVHVNIWQKHKSNKKDNNEM